jgi:hypothetical protein
MAESKYGEYIKTKPNPNPKGIDPNEGRTDAPPRDMSKDMVSLDSEYPPGAFLQECSWIVKAYPDNVWARAHIHDFDETLNFFGSDTDDVNDLCGEIELWLEDEEFLLTESCSIFVPKGMKHGPVVIKRVDRPIFHFICGLSDRYERTLV